MNNFKRLVKDGVQIDVKPEQVKNYLPAGWVEVGPPKVKNATRRKSKLKQEVNEDGNSING